MRITVTLLLLISLVLAGCTSPSQSDDEKLPTEIEKFYVQLESQSGFSDQITPDLYNTYWSINIYNNFGIDIPGEIHIKEWINNIDINDLMNKENQERSEFLTTMYLSLRKDLGLGISKELKDKSISFFKNGQSIEVEDGIINDDLIKLSSILDFDIEEKQQVSKVLYQAVKSEGNIYYAYLYTLLGYKLPSGILEELSQIDNSNLDAIKLNNLFYLKIISEYNDSHFNHSINSNDIDDLITKFIFDSSQTDIQYISQFMYVFKNQIDEKNIYKLTSYLTASKKEKGWIDPQIPVIDLYSTRNGLLIASYYNSLNLLDTKNIKSFLQNIFNEISSDWDTFYGYLPFYTESIVYMEDNDEMDKVQEFLNKRIDIEIHKKYLDVERLIPLIESSIILGTEHNLQKILTEKQKNELSNSIQLSNEENTLTVYYKSLLKRVFQIDSKDLDLKYLEFKDDMSRDLRSNKPIEIFDLLVVLRTLHFNDQLNKISEEEMYEFNSWLNKQLDINSGENLTISAMIIESLDILKK